MPAKAAAKKPEKKPEGSSGGKAKKKKWSKGKVRDKLNNMVLFDKATYDKCVKDLPQYKLITPAIICERFKVRGSLARAILRELAKKNLIRPVVKHSRQEIYTRATKEDVVAEQEAAKEATTEKKGGGGVKKGAKKNAAAAAAEEAAAE